MGEVQIAGQKDLERAQLRYLPGESVEVAVSASLDGKAGEGSSRSGPRGSETRPEERLEAANREVAEGRCPRRRMNMRL